MIILSIYFKGDNQAVISNNLQLFKAFVLDAVIKNTGLSAVRVSHIQVRVRRTSRTSMSQII